MAEEEQGRTEQATPFKLREAKRRGSVARSQELNAAAIILACAAVLGTMGAVFVREELHMSRTIFAQAGSLNLTANSAAGWLGALLQQSLHIVLPLFVVFVIVAVLINLLQTGPVFSTFPLKPDFDRINPIKGFKRFFSARLIFDLVKNLIKFVLYSAALYWIFGAMMPRLAKLSTVSVSDYPAFLIALIVEILFKLGAIMLFIALLDFAFSRWDYLKRLRMSRHEIKEESKRREGDPRIRSRIRELQREMLKRSSTLKRVSEADVLITNPQHLAVALSYDREKMAAPQVIVKGAGELAQAMKRIAARNRVPVIRNRRLARELFKLEFNSFIPERLYPSVAKILVWAYGLRDENQEPARGAG